MKPFSPLLRGFCSICLHLLFLVTCNSLWFCPNTTASASGNESDHLALLKFKESISSDPYDILVSWNSSTHFCNWHGITCTTTLKRVTELNLPGYQLHGSISPHVGNLSFLTKLNLQNNSFYGKIPPELGRLQQLEQISLTNNSLTGEFPTNLTSCFQLKLMNLRGNNLIGKIPIEIGSLWKLQFLNVINNKLTGRIPASVGNLSSLIRLDLSENHLEGKFPQEIGHLKNLAYLSLDINKLSGTLFNVIYNLSSLTIISAASNEFNGSIPSVIFPKLQIFEIGDNQFSGPIPVSIINASALQILAISQNHFTGNVPTLGNLQDLRILLLGHNNLGSNSTKDLEFLKSMTNCSKLYRISIAYNNFGGHLPNSLGNLSNQLSRLYLGGNYISGNIPVGLGNLINLTLLTMENNQFEGMIPITFGNFQKMQVLELARNKLSGEIPSFIGNLTQLFTLNLRHNMFQGNISPSIGNCQKLQHFDLSQNYLRGTIPLELFSLSSLTSLLDLSQNSLSGSLPAEVGNLESVTKLKVSENHLSGDIPGTIAECTSLEYLYLQGNLFDGFIPSSLKSMKGLRRLDLSRNRLHGSIPKGLQNISLEFLNVSFNMLEGEVPTGGVFQNASGLVVIGNNKLCGGISKLHLPPCPIKGKKPAKHHTFRLIVAIVSVVSCLLILSFILTIYWMKKRNKQSSSDSPSIELLPKVSYENLHHGTDGFSTINLIGFGSFGCVYKGTIGSEDRVVAIKVLNLQKKGAHKSFIVESNALRNIRHRNLVEIVTCCSGIDYKGQEFKALILEYMRNGSLEQWLHPSTTSIEQPRRLDLHQRINIIIDVASALHYLHYECEQIIIHCDLKPSNILLDDDLIAHVSDFGLAKLVSTIDGTSHMQTSTSGMKGTVGYAPPEYGVSSDMSTYGDTYSFGILMLEMLTGRRPTDEMFEDGRNLRNFVETSFPNDLLQILDPQLVLRNEEATLEEESNRNLNPNAEKCLVSL